MAGTAVLTTLGKKAIEDIRIGDKIPCVDHITGEESEKRVVATSVNKTDKLVELEIGGEIIRCTETHPFQVKDRGWVDAAELVPGDLVYRKNWQISPVQHVTLVTFDEPVAVYNFEVEDCHTYYIGDGCWLVHNACTQQGSYEIFAKDKFGNNKVYVGKGPLSRMNSSIKRVTKQGYNVIDSQWTSAPNSQVAFIDEYMKMAKYDFDFGGKMINRIMSPGFRIFNSWL